MDHQDPSALISLFYGNIKMDMRPYPETIKSKEESPMQQQESVQINITISKEDHDLMVKLAAERNLNDPNSGATKGGIGREIISGYLETVREERIKNTKP
jgi:hypothetical protein